MHNLNTLDRLVCTGYYIVTLYIVNRYTEELYSLRGQMNLNKFLPMTETTYYIMLSLVEPLHGYGIMQQVKTLSGGHVDIAPGTMYGALENLKKQALITLVAEDDEKRRKIYSLTELGQQVIRMEFQRMKNLVAVSSQILERQA